MRTTLEATPINYRPISNEAELIPSPRYPSPLSRNIGDTLFSRIWL